MTLNYSRNVTPGAVEGEPGIQQDFSDYLKTTLGLSDEIVSMVESVRKRMEQEKDEGEKYEGDIERAFIKMGDFMRDFEERRVQEASLRSPSDSADLKFSYRDIFAVTISGGVLFLRLGSNGHHEGTYYSSDGKEYDGSIAGDEDVIKVGYLYSLQVKTDSEGEEQKNLSTIIAMASCDVMKLIRSFRKEPVVKKEPRRRRLGFIQ